MRQLVLASTSPYRRELLSRLGLPFACHAPLGVDEELAKREETDPEALARRLAREKAASLAGAYPDALVLGSDQVGALLDPQSPGGWVLMGKPGTERRAVAQLEASAGRELRLLTAVAILDTSSGRLEESLDEHRIGFRQLGHEAYVDYVRRERPLDCAGSFKLEGLGPALMRYCRGEDFTGVVGLPLMQVTVLLRAHGVAVLGGA